MGTLSIKARITLAAGSCLFVMVLCLVGFSIQQMRDTSAVVSASSTQALSQASMQYLEAMGSLQANGIEQRFLSSLMFTRSLATQVVMMRRQAKQNGLAPAQLRGDLYRLIRAQVATTPEILGVGISFEPNALDGADGSAINGVATPRAGLRCMCRRCRTSSSMRKKCSTTVTLAKPGGIARRKPAGRV
jgi:methyl-accepting chemotaxis protein